MAHEAAEILHHLIGHADREHLVALYLNARHQVTHAHHVSVGTVNSSLVHPREVFKGACLANATALIVGHNHPSGSVGPSLDDRIMTSQLESAGALLKIPVIDSIIVGPGTEFYSFNSGHGTVAHRHQATSGHRDQAEENVSKRGPETA
jgi:DNA repair protein RadC